VLNGILCVLRTGAHWADLPEAYPSFQACHRRFQQWVRSGVMRGILEALALDLKHSGAIDVCFTRLGRDWNDDFSLG